MTKTKFNGRRSKKLGMPIESLLKDVITSIENETSIIPGPNKAVQFCWLRSLVERGIITDDEFIYMRDGLAL